MSKKNKDNVANRTLEEKQIKIAVIDLLHNNKEVTYDAISKATGMSTFSVKKHSESIKSMLTKLKKVHDSPNFKR